MKTKSFFTLLIIISCFLSMPTNAQHSWHWTVTEAGIVLAVDCDNLGNVYVTGSFTDNIVLFGETVIPIGRQDVFIASFKSDGTLNWIKSGGGVWEDSGMDICTDNNFVYVTGIFHEQFSIGDTSLNSAGAMDVFIAKYDIDGNFQWAESAGGVTDDKGKSIALDDLGNVVITGDINYVAKFGDFTVPYVGFSDMFVAKYDSDGVCQWAKSAGGTLYDSGECIEVAKNGDVVVAGGFGSQVSFDTKTITAVDYVDVYIARYSTDGTFEEVVSAGGTGNELIQCLAIDSLSNIYISGWYMDNITIGGEKHYSSGVYDIFIGKYKPNSGFIWSKSYGGTGSDESLGMDLNSDNDLILTGTFEQSVDFDVKVFNSMGYSDGFLAQMDTSGTFDWIYQVEGTGSLTVHDCAADRDGNSYIAGDFVDELNIGGSSFTPAESVGLFLAKLAESASGIDDNISEINSDCYPNPFIGSTAISYSLKNREKICLKVYNSSGNLIKVIINEIQNTGKHVVDFNGFNLPSGIYFYILETEEGMCTRKMVKL